MKRLFRGMKANFFQVFQKLSSDHKSYASCAKGAVEDSSYSYSACIKVAPKRETDEGVTHVH